MMTMHFSIILKEYPSPHYVTKIVTTHQNRTKNIFYETITSVNPDDSRDTTRNSQVYHSNDEYFDIESLVPWDEH